MALQTPDADPVMERLDVKCARSPLGSLEPDGSATTGLNTGFLDVHLRDVRPLIAQLLTDELSVDENRQSGAIAMSLEDFRLGQAIGRKVSGEDEEMGRTHPLAQVNAHDRPQISLDDAEAELPQTKGLSGVLAN